MTQTTAFRSAVLPSNNAADNAAETYSNDLMDDLFSDVDQILGGDLSEYMTVVGRQTKSSRASSATPAAHTVQLPSYSLQSLSESAAYGGKVSIHQRSRVGPSIGDRSYALNVRAAVPRSAHPSDNLSGTSACSERNLYRHAYSRASGGRPVTVPRSAMATGAVSNAPSSASSSNSSRYTAAESGNFHSAIIPVSAQATQDASDQSIYAAPEEAIQSVSNRLYPQTASPQRDFTFASPRPPHTVFEPEAQKVSLPFLLIGAAGISAVSTVGLWSLSQSASSTGWRLALNREASAAELPGNSTEDFLAYLQQSLDVISARQASSQTLAAVIPVANRASTLPTTVPNTNPAPQSSVLPNLPGAAIAAAPKVIERVFVPVYQNAQAQTKAAPSVPSVAVPNSSAQLPKVPVPAPVAAAAAIPPGAPAAAAPSVPIVPVGSSKLPTPTAPASVAISPANAAAATDTTPTSNHVLVGVLNLGSRSAALFNIDGTSQRAYVGDRIGVSDWTLVSVNGQDVQVRRDGEVRSIYIGQRF